MEDGPGNLMNLLGAIVCGIMGFLTFFLFVSKMIRHDTKGGFIYLGLTAVFVVAAAALSMRSRSSSW